jgi:hypothetical protein
MNRPWLRAGLIGAGILIVLSLLGLVPLVSCIAPILQLVAFAGIGALAASYIPPRRETGQGAGQGALAGLIAGLVGALVSTILAPLSLSASGGTAAIINQLPPESLQQLQQAGIDPAMFINSGTVAGATALCCLPTGLIAGALLGALGGLIFASAKPE